MITRKDMSILMADYLKAHERSWGAQTTNDIIVDMEREFYDDKSFDYMIAVINEQLSHNKQLSDKIATTDVNLSQ